MKKLFYISDSRICGCVHQVSGEDGGVKKENQKRFGKISYPFANKGAKDRRPEETCKQHSSKNSYIYVFVQTQNMFYFFFYLKLR